MMQNIKQTIWNVIIQILAWLIAGVLFYIYLGARIPRAELSYLLGITLSSFISYLILIYGYVLFFYPKYHGKNNLPLFIVVVLLFFLVVLAIRVFIENKLVGPLTSSYATIFTYSKTHILYAVTSSFIALIVGILLNAFFQNIKAQKLLAEQVKIQNESQLQLLKSQLSPHFIFNSLNSMYYDTYKILPDVAARMIMMSDLVRYFFTSNDHSKVPLEKEIDHILKLIELEKVRINDPENIHFTKKISGNYNIAPMLLFPFIENLFKHGLDEENCVGNASIWIIAENNLLKYKISNKKHPSRSTQSLKSGTGLKNLNKRLELLSNDHYLLEFNDVDGEFIASLEFPVYED